MHCLPVRRGVTDTERILHGPRSVVISEARNRMPAQMAVLHRMLFGVVVWVSARTGQLAGFF